MAERKYQFERLTPIDNMDLDVYEEAIDYVFDNSDIKNVAISGAYSAGKSSVLASYKKNHSNLRFLHISLAHFKSPDQEDETEIKESVLEGKILNQLIHQIPSEKIPQTNFRVKKKVNTKSVIRLTIGAVLFLVSTIYFFCFDMWKNYLSSLPDNWFKTILTPSTHQYALMVDGVLMVALLSFVVYRLISVQKNKNIFRKLNLNGNEIEIFEESDDSYFDKYLNEVLYLFENSELLNSLDSGATTKITINNRRLNRANFEQSILMPMRGDACDVYRREYNQMLLDKTTGANGIIQEKYITVSVCKKDIEEARTYFSRVGADLIAHSAALGSKCTELDAAEKLRVLHDFYRQGEEAAFHFDPQDMMHKGHNFKDYICPDSMEKSSDCLKLGEKYCRVLFLKDYASYIKDSMVTELTDFNRNMMLSIDVVPIPTDEAVREVENRLLGIETNITNWQRRQNANNNFSAVVPYDMELQRKESKEFLDDLTTRDQRMMLAVITMVITADDKNQLDSDTETVLAVARKHMCQLAVLKFQQIDGLNTVLPIGTRKINAFRTLTTESLAVFMPFKVQEVQDKGGIYFGENAISHNLIMCNKANLLNQSAFLLGVPGSGKSFSAKELIAFLILNTADDVLVCDPENEFGALAAALGKETATVIHMAAGGKDRLNAMYMVDGYGENNPIVEKSQFIMSLVEQIDKAGVGPQQKSIIDRCTALVYQDAEQTGKPATLCDLRNKLLEQPEEKAKEIALSLELFTTGSLDIFGHESTVDLDKRIVVFDIHGLGEQLKPTGLLVITDTILNRVTLNWKKGKRTHIFIDEFHVVFENEQSGIFFNSAWRQFRKRNGYPTAITQNVEYLLDSVQASTMLSNSEFVVMLNQAFSDRAKLSKLLNISDEQMSYVTNADAGCGLIKYGSALVPFINRFPKDTELYRLMTTRPGEGVFGSGNAS